MWWSWSEHLRPDRRTRLAAETMARAIATYLDADLAPTIDLLALADELFASAHPRADAALDLLTRSAVAVVATPVLQAGYSGLLKSFLDLCDPAGLTGVVAVPLVLTPDLAYTMVGDVHLRPLLVELGATVPTRSVALTEGELGSLVGTVAAWLASEGSALSASLTPVLGAVTPGAAAG